MVKRLHDSTVCDASCADLAFGMLRASLTPSTSCAWVSIEHAALAPSGWKPPSAAPHAPVVGHVL